MAVLLLLAFFLIPGCSRGEREGSDSLETAGGKGEEKPITSFADLRGKRIASLTGTVFDISINKKIDNVTHLYFNDTSAMVQALRAGKVSAWAVDEPVGRLVMAQFPDLELLPERLSVDHYGFAVRKGSPLGPQASAVIERLQRDGTMKAMEKKWFGADPSMKTMPDLSGEDSFDGSAGVIRFGHDTVTEPMSYVGDKGSSLGLDVETALRIAHGLNMKIELVPINFGALIESLQAKKVDMIAGCMTITEERKKSVDFTVPYYSGGQALMVKKAIPLGKGQKSTEKGIKDLSKFGTGRVGVMTGAVAEFYMEEKYPNAVVSSYDNIADGVTALQSHKLDYVMTAYTTALNFVKHNRDLVILPDKLMNEGAAIAVAKGNDELLGRLENLLTRYRKNGTLEKMAARWIKESDEPYEAVAVPRVGQGKRLRVGIAANREPMSFVMNNGFAGFDIELIERMAYDLGMIVEYHDMQYSALVLALQSGKVDAVVANMTPTKERKEKVNFTSIYYHNPQIVMVKREDVAQRITDLSQLKGKKVGVFTGSAYEGLLSRRIPGAVAERFNSVDEAVAGIRAGRVSAFLTDETKGRALIKKAPGARFLSESSGGRAFAFPKGQERLRDQVNVVLKRLKQRGEIQRIEAKWFGDEEKVKTLPALRPKGGAPLRFASDAGSAPFAYRKDGKIVGSDIETAMIVAEALGRSLEVVDLETAAVIPSLREGENHMAGFGRETGEPPESLLFSDPYLSGGAVIIADTEGGSREGTDGKGFWPAFSDSFRRTFLTEERYLLVWQGVKVTLLISILSALFGTLLGFGICTMRRAKSAWACLPAKVFIRTVQGTPIVVLLMILYYIVFSSVDINPVVVAVIGFSINFAAYVSEMMRTGIDAVDKGQHEAAVALGFNRFQVFSKITLPQALRHELPVFKGEFVSMLKMTSVVGYIAIQDLTKMSDIIRSRTYEAFFPLIATALIYFAIAYAMTALLSLVELKIDPKQRKRVVKGVSQ